MIQIGRTVIMEMANYSPAKSTYGKVLEQIEKDKIKVLWKDGTISIVPEFWVGTFSCDNKVLKEK
jgi:hypothetical protein